MLLLKFVFQLQTTCTGCNLTALADEIGRLLCFGDGSFLIIATLKTIVSYFAPKCKTCRCEHGQLLWPIFQFCFLPFLIVEMKWKFEICLDSLFYQRCFIYRSVFFGTDLKWYVFRTMTVFEFQKVFKWRIWCTIMCYNCTLILHWFVDVLDR